MYALSYCLFRFSSQGFVSAIFLSIVSLSHIFPPHCLSLVNRCRVSVPLIFSFSLINVWIILYSPFAFPLLSCYLSRYPSVLFAFDPSVSRWRFHSYVISRLLSCHLLIKRVQLLKFFTHFTRWVHLMNLFVRHDQDSKLTVCILLQMIF